MRTDIELQFFQFFCFVLSHSECSTVHDWMLWTCAISVFFYNAQPTINTGVPASSNFSVPHLGYLQFEDRGNRQFHRESSRSESQTIGLSQPLLRPYDFLLYCHIYPMQSPIGSVHNVTHTPVAFFASAITTKSFYCGLNWNCEPAHMASTKDISLLGFSWSHLIRMLEINKGMLVKGFPKMLSQTEQF